MSQEALTPTVLPSDSQAAAALAQFKQEYGDVRTLTLTDDDTGETVAVAYLKRPVRATVARAVSLLSQSKVLEAGEFLLENCFVGGDQRILSDEWLKMSAAMKAVEIVKLLDGELKKS
jgi:hypothetical protein